MQPVDVHAKVDQLQKNDLGAAAAAPVVDAAAAAAKAAAGAAKAAAAKAAKEAKLEEQRKAKEAAKAVKATAAPAEEEDKLVLTGAEQGKVVTRFPPEASGFLHIGHAKAALVNSMLRSKFEGKMIFRFDDTNPEKERHEFEQAICDDLKSLEVVPDVGPTYSSDYFELMMEKCTDMIQRGDAYADITSIDEMRKARFDGYATPCRDNSVEENMRLWKEMQAGTEEGQTACIRAKISIDNANKAMRDPVLYRVNLTPHARHGEKYKAYPTYDFCCPIVDSVEGVTHALRTNEYHDRNAQYEWICNSLGLRIPTIEDFSRLNMEYTLMSKRKLTKLVNDGTVTGWDDPRMPTVRGLIRRGLQMSALRDFVKVQGMSKAVNLMEWSKLWNYNNQAVDATAARYTVVSAETPVKCIVTGAPGHLVALEKLRHKKNESLGMKKYYHSDCVFLDAEDVLLLKEGEEVTLMDWGNAFIRNIQKNDDGVPVSADLELNPQGDVRKTKYKLTWVPENPQSTKLALHEFDHVLTKKKPEEGDELSDILSKVTEYKMTMIGEEALAEVAVGQVVQLERRGFYRVDAVTPTMALFALPDGRDKVNHLSAKAQHLKKNPPPAPAAGKEAKKKTANDDGLTLEQKRALKAAKKAASAKKE